MYSCKWILITFYANFVSVSCYYLASASLMSENSTSPVSTLNVRGKNLVRHGPPSIPDTVTSAADQTGKLALHPYPMSEFAFQPVSNFQPQPRFPFEAFEHAEPYEMFIPLKKPFKKKPSYPSDRVITADPLLVLAIVALPFLALLAFSVVVIPLVPLVIYLFAAFSPGAGVPIGKRKRRSPTNSHPLNILDNNALGQVNRALNKVL